MSFARVFLICSLVVAAGGVGAQTQGLPPGLTRNGDVVMMRPISDGSGASEALISQPHASRLHILSPTQHALYLRAFDAAAHEDWVTARRLSAQGQDVTAQRLVEWRYALDRDSGASFEEINDVMKFADQEASDHWPLSATLQSRAEAAIVSPYYPDALSPAAIISWFDGRDPISGIGKVRLGEALVASGQKERGTELIRAGWEEGSFDAAIERDILLKDGDLLRPANERARLDELVWRDEIGAARRQMTRVNQRSREVGEARIALASGLSSARAALRRVRNSDDPSLLFDWSHALRLEGEDDQAHRMLLRIPPQSLVENHPTRWWAECNAQARDALAAGNPHLALRIVEHAGLTQGDNFADQEFLAGFIALRILHRPAAALADFERESENVSRPISKARAEYWRARAYEALGETTNALAHYKRAAVFPETFYGQIALAHIATPAVLHIDDTVEPAPVGEVESDPLMPEMKVLADLGQSTLLRLFIERDATNNPDPAHLKELMILLNDWGYPELAVRLGKLASYEGALMANLAYPVIAIPQYLGPGTPPDPALILALIRQETEFNPAAISPVGALGLMQMMPQSARAAAKMANLPYRPEALLSDIDYNMELGMTEYRSHLDHFDGSYVLAAAAYNAGPTNTRKWIAINGDPRSPGVDPIDWIELIPFGETRNYVQRVLEATEVYRARLANKDIALRIMDDLFAPGHPSLSAMTHG